MKVGSRLDEFKIIVAEEAISRESVPKSTAVGKQLPEWNFLLTSGLRMQ